MKFSMEAGLGPDDPQIPETTAEYMAIVRGLTALTLLELRAFDSARLQDKKERWVQRLPGLISLVNTIGYLRGQDGFFLEKRPEEMGEYSDELYKLEDKSEKLLTFNLEELCKNPANIPIIRERLDHYFIQARIPQKIVQEYARRATERYTVHVKDIQIDPAILEDKTFESWSVLELDNKVQEYLETAYPGVYKNHYTISRLTQNAIKNGDGISINEQNSPENRKPLIPIELYSKDTQDRYQDIEYMRAQNRELTKKCFLEQDDLYLALEQERHAVLSDTKKQLTAVSTEEAKMEMQRLEEEKMTQIDEKYKEKVRKLWERCDTETKRIWKEEN